MVRARNESEVSLRPTGDGTAGAEEQESVTAVASGTLEVEEAGTQLQPTPLPRTQLGVLFLCTFADVVALFQVSPYVPFLIMFHTGLSADDDEVALLSGVFNGLYSFTLLFAAPFWGKASDRFGRKKIIIIGLLSNLFTLSLLGLSGSLWQAMLARALVGLFNSNIAVFQAMLGEIVDTSNQATGFGLYGMTFSVAAMAAPVVGGPLYGRGPEAYPALYPCMVPLVLVVVALIGTFFMEETVKDRDEHGGVAGEESSSATVATGGFSELFGDRLALLLCFLYGLAAMFYYSFVTVLPLWATVEQVDGGWEWDSSSVGVALFFCSMGAVTSQAFIFPRAVQRLGFLVTYRLGWVAPALVFGLWPLLQFVPEVPAYAQQAVLFSEMFLTGLFMTASFASLNVIIRNAVPSHILGITNGLCQSSKGLLSTLGPIGLSAIFAASMHDSGIGTLLGHHLVFVILSLIVVFLVCVSLFIPSYLNRPGDTPKPGTPVYEETETETDLLMQGVADQSYGTTHSTPAEQS